MRQSAANSKPNATYFQINRGITLRPATNTFEVMAFVGRARSLALGEQPGVGSGLDLAAQFSFSDKWYDHSGEFNRAIQAPQGSQFYTRLLKALRTGGL
jgi:hypothetical protein